MSHIYEAMFLNLGMYSSNLSIISDFKGQNNHVIETH